jgi:hypothetical protein
MKTQLVYELVFDHNSTYLVPASSMSEAIARAMRYIGPKANISKVEEIRHIALVEE